MTPEQQYWFNHYQSLMASQAASLGQPVKSRWDFKPQPITWPGNKNGMAWNTAFAGPGMFNTQFDRMGELYNV